MTDLPDLEALWEGLLGRDPAVVRATYGTLQPDEQQAVFAHLQQMATEPDWHPAQRESAQIALDALADDTTSSAPPTD